LYSNEVSPRFNAISIAGAHMRDAGCTAVEEMAYTLANGLAYVDELTARGGDVTKFARRLSFFFYVHMDLFEEACKFRAGRRLWAKLLRERYGVTDERALHFRFGVVCGGSSLVAAQPYNNIARVAIENVAAVLGGAQSIFTCAYDEAFQIPTEFSAEIALCCSSSVSRAFSPATRRWPGSSRSWRTPWHERSAFGHRGAGSRAHARGPLLRHAARRSGCRGDQDRAVRGRHRAAHQPA
jgi:methylmalonyl-CoA mutase cobalamin-binding domain/chain